MIGERSRRRRNVGTGRDPLEYQSCSTQTVPNMEKQPMTTREKKYIPVNINNEIQINK